MPATILFSDIVGFTTLSEKADPEELVRHLNEYLSAMTNLVFQNGGTLDKFIGDAIMAIFGAPMTRPNDAENSVQAALLMIQALEGFNQSQTEKGKVNFGIGVGINTGEAIVGNIGSEQKIDYTVIGDTVNLASRLEGLTKKYHSRIIVSEFTKDDITEGKFYFRELDNVRVKGKIKPVKIYEPFDLAAAKPLIPFYEEHAKYLNDYVIGNFQSAKAGFEKLIASRPEDYLSFIYKERCEYLLLNNPKDWDGVETWTEK